MPARRMLQPVLFVVPRLSHDERTVAIVHAEVSSQALASQAAFLQALMKAVTTWVQTTRAGRSAWAHSHADLNVGDLYHHQDTASLRQKLIAAGIHRLRIECHVDLDRSAWTYDTILVDDTALDASV